MNYDFCLNPCSLPVNNISDANTYLNDIFVGIVELCDDNSQMSLYSNEQLNKTKITDSYTFYDYKMSLMENDRELADFVFNLEDRSPFLDFLSESEIMDIMKYNFTLFDLPLDSSEYDILKFACLKDAILISLPTNNLWINETIPVAIKNVKSGTTEKNDILNIYNSIVSHLKTEYDWKMELKNIVFSTVFDQWFVNLDEKNQLHVSNLLKRAFLINFHGTIEQTKIIRGSSKKIWEWRGGCPHFGKGRIRVLYASFSEKILILNGFIKSNNDYTGEVRIAEAMLEQLVHENKIEKSIRSSKDQRHEDNP
jgi:hypothetical protein